MAMLECPGCKHIVDDTTKVCVNCGYEVKKYFKQMAKEAKRQGKSFNANSIKLTSVYDNNEDVSNITLDFLKKPEPVRATAPSRPLPRFDGTPATPVTPVAPAPSQAAPAPSAPAAPARTDSGFHSNSVFSPAPSTHPTVPVSFGSLSAQPEKSEPASIFDSPSLNQAAQAAPVTPVAAPVKPVAAPVSSVSPAPAVMPASSLESAAPVKPSVIPVSSLGASSAQTTASAPVFESASLNQPVAPASKPVAQQNSKSVFNTINNSTPEPASIFSAEEIASIASKSVAPAPTPASTVSNDNSLGSMQSQFLAPSQATPERKPIVPNEPLSATNPMFDNPGERMVTTIPEVSQKPQPVSQVSRPASSYRRPAAQVPAGIFDSDFLNEAQANGTWVESSATNATLEDARRAEERKREEQESYNPYNRKAANNMTLDTIPKFEQSQSAASPAAANPLLQGGGFGVGTSGANLEKTTMVQKKEEEVITGIFDSPVLNLQAKKIAEGTYIPESVASEATLDDLDRKRKLAVGFNSLKQGAGVINSVQNQIPENLLGKQANQPPSYANSSAMSNGTTNNPLLGSK